MFPTLMKAFGKEAVLALVFLALIAPMPALAAQQPAQKNAVQGQGCVQAGVEAHCLVLRDLKTGHLYDLLFKTDRPPIGLGIEFTGVLHPGPTACMQGIAVEVTTWSHKTSIKCTPGQAEKGGPPSPR